MFLNNWSDIKGMQGDFQIKDDELVGVNILLASYGTPAYEGSAFVLFEKNGELYEVNASHCSCYGLEGQWDPDRTSKKELLYRVKEGKLGQSDYDCNPFRDELLEVLSKLTDE